MIKQRHAPIPPHPARRRRPRGPAPHSAASTPTPVATGASPLLLPDLVANVWIPITPSDTVDAPPFDTLWVGQGGDVALADEGGRTVVLSAVASNATVSLLASRVLATGTTATNLVGLQVV